MIRNKIISRCKNCGSVEVINYKKSYYVLYVIKLIVIPFFFTFAIMGMLATYSFIQGEMKDKSTLTNVGGFYGSILNIKSIFQSGITPEMKEFTLNITKDCSDDYCKANALWQNLSQWAYVVGQDLDPVKIFAQRYGDCDEMSYLYKDLLNSIKISSVLKCTESHCYNLVKTNKGTYIGDIAQKRWIPYA